MTVAGATGINNSTNNGGIQIWSSENRIYVDFTALQKVNAVVKIYDIIGREVSIGEVTSNNIYVKEIDNIEAADYLVSVRNNDGVITKKVFISNIK
ncbi:MAG TPA: T9SS type A sorting domain-containing protein [Chitinophagales bacterium]|nr:T9SS type A sorting domain-containing protein [Chitinophagales bacterium]